MKRAQKIMDNVWYFPESPMLDCGMYALTLQNGEIAVVDAGNGKSWESFLNGMTDAGLDPNKIKHVLITHEHLDHVLGLYNMENSIKIYAHPVTAKILQNGDKNKIVPPGLGVSASHFGVDIKPLQVEALDLKSDFSLPGFTFKLLNTPGHSLGSVTFYEPTLKLLFPGDVVFPSGSFGRYDFPGGSLPILQKSVKKISELDVEYLCSGHMNPVKKNANRHIEMSLKNITGIRY